MSNPKAYCPNCKDEVDCLVEKGSLYCPHCWNRSGQSDISPETENKKEEVGLAADLLAVLRVFFIAVLVVAGVFLVFLAFAYAACSHMGGI
jgi:hypothetical protein